MMLKNNSIGINVEVQVAFDELRLNYSRDGKQLELELVLN